MRNEPILSGLEERIESIDEERERLRTAIILYYSEQNPSFSEISYGRSPQELSKTIRDQIAFADQRFMLSILAAIEARFRVDYMIRCYKKKGDSVSQVFINKYRRRRYKVDLKDFIFQTWKENTDGADLAIGRLRAAFVLRDWLAHGRYWKPKHQKFSYETIYEIAETTLAAFPLELKL